MSPGREAATGTEHPRDRGYQRLHQLPSGVELDHAQDILTDLLVTVVEATTPVSLSKLEGDAAFMALAGSEKPIQG